MTFSIKINKTGLSGREKEVTGVIRIGEFEETFTTPLTYWSVSDYENHWKSALRRLITGKDSCLITSLVDPMTANFNYWWLLYINGADVFIQDSLLLMNSLPRPFTPDDPYRFIPKHERVNEDGDTISEWTLPLADFKEFLDDLS
jgi:hypothetical protein